MVYITREVSQNIYSPSAHNSWHRSCQHLRQQRRRDTMSLKKGSCTASWQHPKPEKKILKIYVCDIRMDQGRAYAAHPTPYLTNNGPRPGLCSTPDTIPNKHSIMIHNQPYCYDSHPRNHAGPFAVKRILLTTRELNLIEGHWRFSYQNRGLWK